MTNIYFSDRNAAGPLNLASDSRPLLLSRLVPLLDKHSSLLVSWLSCAMFLIPNLKYNHCLILQATWQSNDRVLEIKKAQNNFS